MAAQTQTSSARPEALARYAQQDVHLVQEQLGQASRLSTTLERFQSTCREYPVSVGGLTQQVNHRAQEADQVGGWVRQVGIRFAQADALQQAIKPQGQVLGAMMVAEPASVRRGWWPPELDWGKVRRFVWRLLAPAWLQALWAVADWWQGLGDPQMVDPGDTESMPSSEPDRETTTDPDPGGPFAEILEATSLERIIAALIGTWVDFDGQYGSQCVDLIRKIRGDIKGGKGEARNYMDDATAIGSDGKPTPEPGAVLVWAAGAGEEGNRAGSAGHVAIVESVGPDGYVTVVEQNWPEGTGVTRRLVKLTESMGFIPQPDD